MVASLEMTGVCLGEIVSMTQCFVRLTSDAAVNANYYISDLRLSNLTASVKRALGGHL